MQPPIRDQNTLLRPTPAPVRALLSRKRPIRAPATMPGDLPRDNRLMPPKNHSNRPTRQPTRKLPRNHLPFLHARHHTPHPHPSPPTLSATAANATRPLPTWRTHRMAARSVVIVQSSILGRPVRKSSKRARGRRTRVLSYERGRSEEAIVLAPIHGGLFTRHPEGFESEDC